MRAKGKPQPELYGVAPVGISRYFALYFTQVGWLMLGLYLLTNAYWPSTCRPSNILEVYQCSIKLADNRGWVESSLMTWLWSTPILIMLEISRQYDRIQSRRRGRA